MKHKKLPLIYLTDIRPQVLFSVCATLSSPHLIYTRVTINKVMLYTFTHATINVMPLQHVTPLKTTVHKYIELP